MRLHASRLRIWPFIRADCLASHRNLTTYEFIRQNALEITPEKMHPEPLVTGHDLIAAGHAPGP